VFERLFAVSQLIVKAPPGKVEASDVLHGREARVSSSGAIARFQSVKEPLHESGGE